MNVYRAPHHVVPTPSAKTSWGDTSAGARLDSLLPLEMTGPLGSQVMSFAQISTNASSAGSVRSTRNEDECADPRACPEHTTCHNSFGSYSCVCNPGFESSSGQMSFKGLGEMCEDIDECPGKCPSNAACTNTPGSYFCTCNTGYATNNGQLDFTDQEVECKDIDECFQDPSRCGPNSVCTNVLGSYSCSCIVGFRPNPEGSLDFTCKRVPFKCKEDMILNNEQAQLCQVGAALEPKYVSFCELMNATVSILDDVCKNETTVISLKSTAESFGSVLDQTSTWSNFTKEETSTLAMVILESVESMTLAALLKPSANASQTVQTEYLDIESKIIKKECTRTTGVAFVSLVGMESVLDENFFQDPQAPLANFKRKLRINSHIIQGIMTGNRRDGFSDPVVYTLENIEPKQKSERPICVSWSADVKGGRWAPSGCVILEASATHTVCSCTRMMNLAIIMASGELTMEFSLYVISHVGMAISLVCLVMAIATFLLCQTIRNRNTYLHLHLCLVCAILAGILHYLFLACFFWMLVEAVMLFLMVRNLKVVNYFSSRNIRMLYLCAFGYGLPGLVVAVSAAMQPQGYGMPDRCWLNTETGFIWSFLGPVCTIIMKLSSVSAEVSTLKDTRLLTFKAFAQLFILGCSWVLGIFQIGPVASVMAYLFTIINSLQGAFIFLIHCLLSRQVREEYRRCFTRKTKPRSQSQTSGILLSSVPSTSKT
ncbi:hypothetical protein MC885_005714, partial [Smutsia gigantea]